MRFVLADQVPHTQTWPEAQEQSTDTNTTHTSPSPNHHPPPPPKPSHPRSSVPIHTSSSTINHLHVHSPQHLHVDVGGTRSNHARQPMGRAGSCCPSWGQVATSPVPTSGVRPTAGDRPGTSLSGVSLHSRSCQNSQRKYRALIIAEKNSSYFLRGAAHGNPPIAPTLVLVWDFGVLGLPSFL